MSEHRTTRAPRGRPSTPADSVAPPEQVPVHVGFVLSHLAHLIDATLAIRGGAGDARSFAARSLGVGRDQVVVDTRPLSPVDAVLVGFRLAALIEEHGVSGIIGEDADSSPVWSSISTEDGASRYPVDIHAAFAAGAVAPEPTVIGIERQWNSVSLVGLSTTAHRGGVGDVLDRLRADAGALSNPFTGRTVVADLESSRLRLRVTDDLVGDRADVILSDGVWAELDRHVVGVFRSQERLATAGLATNRGVLLHGPPGVGKSAAVRAIASALAGEVTVVLCGSDVVTRAIGALYEELRRLSPALVVIDDFDRVAPSNGEEMHDLLSALDGVSSRSQGVVTLATANNISDLDPAVRRSARFDVEIEVRPPDRIARVAILERYLRDIAPDVDVTALARLTEGATGADLHGLVTEAVLAAGSEPVSADLLESLARERVAAVNYGVYL